MTALTADLDAYLSPRRAVRFEPDDLPMVSAFCAHQRHRNLSPETMRNLLGRLAMLAERNEGRSLLELDENDVLETLDSVRGHSGGGLEAGSRKSFIVALNGFYRWATVFGHLDRNPIDRVPRPREPRRVPRPVTEDDYALSVIAAETTAMRLMLVLCGSAGLRCKEVAGLRWDGVNLGEHRSIFVVGKGEHERFVPVDDVLAMLLEEHQRTSSSEWVFSCPFYGDRLEPGKVSKTVSTYYRRLGFTWTAHQLRHRFGTEAYEVTRDVRVVQELMGHATPTTTSIYTKVRSTVAREAVAKMRPAIALEPEVTGRR